MGFGRASALLEEIKFRWRGGGYEDEEVQDEGEEKEI